MLEGLIPPVVQLTPDPVVPIWLSVENPVWAAGIEVIGPGNVSCRVVVDKLETARSWPTMRIPVFLPFTDANALWFV